MANSYLRDVGDASGQPNVWQGHLQQVDFDVFEGENHFEKYLKSNNFLLWRQFLKNVFAKQRMELQGFQIGGLGMQAGMGWVRLDGS